MEPNFDDSFKSDSVEAVVSRTFVHIEDDKFMVDGFCDLGNTRWVNPINSTIVS